MTITPRELEQELKNQAPLKVVDVREVDEWNICRIPSAVLIPLSEFDRRAENELDPEDDIVVYCHHGMRSSRAQRFLQAKGYHSVRNLVGGIEDWALQVDPAMRRY